jgi:putative ABC transport system permease protein
MTTPCWPHLTHILTCTISKPQTGGRVINRSESVEESANVICLGSKVAEDLFGGMNPVGQIVKVRNVPLRVIGVMEERGNAGFINADETVYIPIKFGLKRFFNRRWLNAISIQVAEGKDLDALEKRVASVIRRAHNIRVGAEDDFRIFNQQQALQNINQATAIFGAVFYSIAGISLVVGGIGIMNIMLVSVTERTREIGVRMAVGARRGDILLQFLIEALIISLLGGTFGLVLGWMLADLLESILQGAMITEVTPTVVIAALVTSTLVGIFSGLYPAWQASRKNPVEALRYE